MSSIGSAQTRVRASIGAFLVAGLVLAAGCNDESRHDRANFATLEVSPESFGFPKLSLGTSAERLVQIRNISEGKLLLKDVRGNFTDEFTLYYFRGEDTENQILGVDEDGHNHFPKVIEIPPAEVLTLVLVYTPQSEEGASGSVTFDSNDRDHLSVRLPIVTESGGPEINVAPPSLDFGRVPARSVTTLETRVTNIGQAPLVLSQILVNGSSDFSARIRDIDPVADDTVLADPDGDGEPGLAPGASVTIRVLYETPTDGPDAGELSIFSNDPNRREVRVNLNANGATPCIRVTPEAIEFPPTLIERSAVRPLTIESCGGQALTISGPEPAGIAFADGSAGVFTFDGETLPQFPAALPAAEQDEPPPSRTVNVVFTPTSQDAFGGEIVIRSNDPANGEIRVPVVGRGMLNECPVPAVAVDEFNVLPLDLITLDATPSTDADAPDGKPKEYRWVVTARPDGSRAQPIERIGRDPRHPDEGAPPDDPATPTALFFVDLAGTYTIELQVTDNHGLTAPSPDCAEPRPIVTVDAKPGQDIHVQLVWGTPGDSDETDADGSDLDLHFLHPNARGWMIAPLDCYYANINPDWGRLGDPSDDPSLDIDDTNGAGPENINLSNPEDTSVLGGPYRIGVHYYRAENLIRGGSWGASMATVRIYLGGVLAWENAAPKELQRTDHFWDVAGIHWTPAERRVVPIDRYYTNVP